MTNIAFIDCETTGINPDGNFLLEVACIVTDGDLNVLDDLGYNAVISYSKEAALRMRHLVANDFVREMHDKTGLWDLIRGDAAKPLWQVEGELVRYLQSFGNPPRSMPIGGNSPRLDANFLDYWMPDVTAELSYRLVDVSSVAQLVRNWYPENEWSQHVKTSDHTAMHDIQESIREMRFYKEEFFR